MKRQRMKRQRSISPELMEILDNGDQGDESQEQVADDHIREERERDRERGMELTNRNGSHLARKRSNRGRSKKKKKKRSVKLSKTRMISKTKYKALIKKRQHHKKLSLNERKQLDHALFVNYCSCIKSLKYDKKVKDYLEYPVCMSSIYKKRGFKPPKGVTVRCSKFEK